MCQEGLENLPSFCESRLIEGHNLPVWIRVQVDVDVQTWLPLRSHQHHHPALFRSKAKEDALKF